MNTTIPTAQKALPVNAKASMTPGHTPYVSLIQSFQPKMSSKSDIDYRLKLVVAKVEKELLAQYPADKTLPVIERLRHILKGLNYYTHKTSVAIFASPGEEKVVYLDIPVDNKAVIDDSFCIRDIVYCKKQDARYLLLQLSATSSKTWLGLGDNLQLIKSNVCSEALETDEFLHRMEHGLSILLKAYPLPVFVLGAERLTGRFAQITRHSGEIAATIHKDLPQAREEELLTVLHPYLTNWQQVRQTNAVRLVESALHAGKLAQGIEAIAQMAGRKNSRLLVVEKDFTALHAGNPDSEESPFYIRDTVDTIIQKVLEAGGDVEFVDNGILQAFGHIALVQYY